MAEMLWPVDAVSGSPNYTGKDARQAMAALMQGRKTGRTLGARSGVPSGTPSAIVTATSTTWTVLPHNGVMDLETLSTAGPVLYKFDANKTGGVTPADLTNQRVDSICIRQDEPGSGDGTTTPLPVVVYTAGTPGTAGGARGSAGGPPNIPVRCFELAQITVPASGGGSPVVSFVAPFLVATGGITPARNTADYPANPYNGEYCDDPAFGLMRYNGTLWLPDTLVLRSADLGTITVPSGTNQSGTITVPLGFTYPTAPDVLVGIDDNEANYTVMKSAVTTTTVTLMAQQVAGSTASVAHNIGWIAYVRRR